jgi:Uma2 family endonuclease
MSAGVVPTPAPVPRPVRWTCDEFHQMGEDGHLEGRHAMLIDGIVLEQGPMNPPHAIALELTTDRLRAIFAAGWRVRVQLPLVLSLVTDPEPDLAVLPGNPRDALAHPTTASLVVEIADATLDYDLGEKANLYAAGGIPDYWVVDIPNRRLHVFRDPAPNPAQVHGHEYRQRQEYGPGDSVAPLAATASSVLVGDLLP